MSSVISAMPNPAFRIVSLPRELQTTEEVLWYVTDIVKLGTVKRISISQNTAQNGLVYHSANVELVSWNDAYLANMLTDTRQMTMNSYYLDQHGDTVNFHFENGKPMLHIKFVLQESAQTQNEGTVDVTHSWSSIYIPVIPSDIEIDQQTGVQFNLKDEDGIKRFFEHVLLVGKVSRVDFASRSIQDSNSSVRSAYVHFDQWFDTASSRRIREQIDGRGEFSCNGYYEGNEFRRFSNRRFMVFKMNRNPIPEANPEANIHQLAARNVELEAEVLRLKTEAEDLKAKLLMLETMNDTLNEKLGASQIEAACLWDTLAADEKGPMTLAELTV